MPALTAATGQRGGSSARRVRPKPADRERERDVPAGDRRRPRSPVRDDDVAVDQDAALPERLEVHGSPQASPDQPLDLLHPTVDTASAAIALGPRLGAAWQHRVLGGHPAATAALTEGRHTLLDRGGAEDPRVSHCDERAALGIGNRMQFDRCWAKLIGGTFVWAHWSECIGRPNDQRRKIRWSTMIETS